MGYTHLEKVILSEIRDLPPHYQRILLDIIRCMKTGCSSIRKNRDILELKGCGKELWNQTDAPKYIARLRNEWD
jgi:hypothetical protein